MKLRLGIFLCILLLGLVLLAFPVFGAMGGARAPVASPDGPVGAPAPESPLAYIQAITGLIGAAAGLIGVVTTARKLSGRRRGG